MMAGLIEVHSARVGRDPNTVQLDVTVDPGTGPIRLPSYVHYVENWQAIEQDITDWVSSNQNEIIDTPPDPVDPLTVWLPRREFRLAMLHNGLSDAVVTNAIDAIEDEGQRQEMRIFWEDTHTFDRQHPHLTSLSSAAGLTETQVNEMWVYGVNLLNAPNYV